MPLRLVLQPGRQILHLLGSGTCTVRASLNGTSNTPAASPSRRWHRPRVLLFIVRCDRIPSTTAGSGDIGFTSDEPYEGPPVISGGSIVNCRHVPMFRKVLTERVMETIHCGCWLQRRELRIPSKGL